MGSLDRRRLAPRVQLDGLCGVVSGQELRHATLLDLSALGLRIEHLLAPSSVSPLVRLETELASPQVQLEIELPGIDEIVWASGEVTFTELSPLATGIGQLRFRCRAGIRIDRVARHERRLLRDYVIETRRAQRAARACARARS